MTTSKLLDKLYKNITWLIVLVSIIGYLAYRTFQMEVGIESVARDPNTWFNIAFVIWLNLNVLNGAIDNGISAGVDSDEFKLPDEVNNKIIKSVNNEMAEFRKYVKTLNYNERVNVEDNLLFKYGVESKDLLTKKQLKKLKKLKPIKHDIYGFNLPLFYELTSNGEVKYASSFNKNGGIWKKRIEKIISSVLFGAISIKIAFNVDNFVVSMVSVIVIIIGVIINYLISFMSPMFRLRYVIPKAVLLKHTLYSGYIEYKNGTHKLKEIPIDKPKEEEIKAEIEEKKEGE